MDDTSGSDSDASDAGEDAVVDERAKTARARKRTKQHERRLFARVNRRADVIWQVCKRNVFFEDTFVLDPLAWQRYRCSSTPHWTFCQVLHNRYSPSGYTKRKNPTYANVEEVGVVACFSCHEALLAAFVS
jgi:hypothetical protein